MNLPDKDLARQRVSDIDEVLTGDATEQARKVAAGEVSPAELVLAALARIDEHNAAINAVVHRFEDAALARSRDPALAGPFRGVPIVLKDAGALMAGMPNHVGCAALRNANWRTPFDSFVTQKIQDAGFVICGRTNTPEFALRADTQPNAYGPTRNPWDLSRSPGGSSGGSAAAVASGMIAVAHANDGGGSIRIPADACGLVGLKPSRGRISAGPFAAEMPGGVGCEGVLTRSVRDSAALLDVLHGWMPGDPYTAPHVRGSYAERILKRGPRMHIGILESVSGMETDPARRAAVTQTALLLEQLGHSVEQAVLRLPSAEAIAEVTAENFAVIAATLVETFSNALGRELRPPDIEPLTFSLARRGRSRSAAEAAVAAMRRSSIVQVAADWWAHGHDLLLTPTMSAPTPPAEARDCAGGDTFNEYLCHWRQFAFTPLWNFTGQPAISIPVATDPETGMPVGVQLVGAYGREDLLLDVASELEEAGPWADRFPFSLAES